MNASVTALTGREIVTAFPSTIPDVSRTPVVHRRRRQGGQSWPPPLPIRHLPHPAPSGTGPITCTSPSSWRS
ncbi:hypothetical protein SGPA1_11687 [Streptomyces misionensis JCM 4497]